MRRCHHSGLVPSCRCSCGTVHARVTLAPTGRGSLLSEGGCGRARQTPPLIFPTVTAPLAERDGVCPGGNVLPTGWHTGQVGPGGALTRLLQLSSTRESSPATSCPRLTRVLTWLLSQPCPEARQAEMGSARGRPTPSQGSEARLSPAPDRVTRFTEAPVPHAVPVFIEGDRRQFLQGLT